MTSPSCRPRSSSRQWTVADIRKMVYDESDTMGLTVGTEPSTLSRQDSRADDRHACRGLSNPVLHGEPTVTPVALARLAADQPGGISRLTLMPPSVSGTATI